MSNPIKLAEIARIAEGLDALCGDDERCFSDMMEGETDITAIVATLHEDLSRDGELIAGITQRQESLSGRKRRLSTRVSATKNTIGKFLRAAKVSSLELPEATYSVRDGKASLLIIDPKAVPFEFSRITTEPNKGLINKEFQSTETLPNWLCREPARDVVTARAK